MSKYGVFSGPCFRAFGPDKSPYLDTFHAVFDQGNIQRGKKGDI